jgi:hypothetical protein
VVILSDCARTCLCSSLRKQHDSLHSDVGMRTVGLIMNHGGHYEAKAKEVQKLI